MDKKIPSSESNENTLAKKPKYIENFWKNLIFIYGCLMQSISITLSLLDTSTLLVLDIFMFLLYFSASLIIIALIIYLHKNRKQTFEEANKGNTHSHEVSYSMCGEKVDLYLRFGIILIGSLSVVYVILSNAKLKIFKSGCLNVGLIFSSITQCMFFILQAIFILKYHSVVILKHIRLIEFGLYNIIFVNITTWEISSLSKIAHSGNLQSAENINCTIYHIDKLYLYFLPAVSEYSVIGMAIIYEIMKRLGKTALIETLSQESKKNLLWRIRNSIPGFIIGIIVVIICICFTTFIIINDNLYNEDWIFHIHNGEEIILYIFTTIIVFGAFSKTRKLKFSFTFLPNNVDLNLLYVSCFLSISFSVMVCSYCFFNFKDIVLKTRGIAAVLEIIQIIIQTITIQDSFYRCSDSTKQHKDKPGQNYLAILIACNFGLWFLKSFQLKNGDVFFNKDKIVEEHNPLFAFFLYATLPLSILYRYHSSSCLAGVYSKIYEGEVDRFEGMLRAEGFESDINYISDSEHNVPSDQNFINTLNAIPRPRSRTITVAPNLEILLCNPVPLKRRQTLKNLETAKLRILSSQLSQTLVRKKLTSTVVPAIQESDSSNNITPDYEGKKSFGWFNKKPTHIRSTSDMFTVKELIQSSLFYTSGIVNKFDNKDNLEKKSVIFSCSNDAAENSSNNEVITNGD